MERWEKISDQTSINTFWKILTEGSVTTDAGSIFLFFTNPTKRPTLGVPCTGALLDHVEWDGRPTSNRPVNTLNTIIRSA